MVVNSHVNESFFPTFLMFESEETRYQLVMFESEETRYQLMVKVIEPTSLV